MLLRSAVRASRLQGFIASILLFIPLTASADFRQVGATVVYSAGYRCSVPFWVRSDMNRDGLDDLVMAFSPTTTFTSVSDREELNFWIGQADGTLREETRALFAGPVTTAYLFSTVLVGDLNGDAIPDVLIPDAGVDTYVNGVPAGPWLGATPRLSLSSQGLWTDASNSLNGLPSTFLHTGALGDIDGDGDLDVYAGSISAGTNSAGVNRTPYLLLNDGKGNFAWNQSRLPRILTESGSAPFVIQADGSRVSSGQQFTGSLFMDHDNDGDQDLIVLASDSTPNGLLLLNDGAGDYTRSTPIDLPPGLYGPGRSRQFTTANGAIGFEQGPGSISLEAEAVDLNNDAYLDLAIVQTVQSWPINYRGGKLQLLINQQGKGFVDESAARGAPGFEASQNYDSYHGTLVVSDINGDSYPDLIALRASADYAADIFLNDGTGRFGRAQISSLPKSGVLAPLASNDPSIVRIASIDTVNKRLVQSPGGTVAQCDLAVAVFEERVTPTLLGLPVKRAYTNTGKFTSARFSGAVTVDGGPPQSSVSRSQAVSIRMTVMATPDDVGKKGRYFTVIRHIRNGASTWSYLGADGQYRPWSTRIADLLPATAVETLGNRTLNVFTGNLDPGEAKIFVGYRVEGDSVLHYSLEPVSVTISD